MPRVECPKCAEWVTVDKEAIGELTGCPRCEAAFPAVLVPDAEVEDKRDGIAGFFSKNYDPENADERSLVIREAIQRVRNPRFGLIVTGIIGILSAIQVAGRKIYLELIVPPVDYDYCYRTAGIGIASGFAYFLVATGGRALRRLEHRPLIFVSAVLAIFSFIYGALSILAVPGLIYGIWSLVALTSSEVKHAMRWKQLERNDRN